MSDDATKDITEKYGTKPTLETLLEMISQMRDEMRAGFVAVNVRIDRIEERLDRFDVRLDRIESEVKLTHSEVYALRADFRELKNSLKVHEPR